MDGWPFLVLGTLCCVLRMKRKKALALGGFLRGFHPLLTFVKDLGFNGFRWRAFLDLGLVGRRR